MLERQNKNENYFYKSADLEAKSYQDQMTFELFNEFGYNFDGESQKGKSGEQDSLKLKMSVNKGQGCIKR